MLQFSITINDINRFNFISYKIETENMSICMYQQKAYQLLYQNYFDITKISKK